MKSCDRYKWVGDLAVLGALALALAIQPAAAATGAAAAQRNLYELHADAGKLGNKECLSCHAGIPKEASRSKDCAAAAASDRKCQPYHRMHLGSKLATPKNCSDCHQSVDLRNGSGAALRKQVDPRICAGCHSGGMKGAKALYAQ